MYAPGSAKFTADVTTVDSIATVSPLPALAGGAGYEIRSYMSVKDSDIGVQLPIYAPTNMTIQGSAHYRDLCTIRATQITKGNGVSPSRQVAIP